MNILHVASEVAPLSRTGGLSDVIGALPAALHQLGDQASVVSPRYGSVDPSRHGLARRLRTLQVPVGDQQFEVGVFEGRLPDGKAAIYLLDHPLFSERPGLYGPPEQPLQDYPDNALRFALLSRGALVLARDFGLQPDVLHAHDWQAALTLYYARHGISLPGANPHPVGKVFTVHNLAFQGNFPMHQAGLLGIDGHDLTPEGLEFYGQINLLKAGLRVADRVTTVSPRYAQEIQTHEFGCGLEGVLLQLGSRLSGILNGADYDRWSPWRDPFLAAPYGKPPGVLADVVEPAAFQAVMAGKGRCKAELQRQLGLAVRADAPLCATITRLTSQKGIELILEVLESEEGWQKGMQYVVVGSGDASYERRLQELARRHPGRMAVHIGFNEALAHRVEAGADIYVMPSQFEPCGLNQMYSMRYGTIPVVRAVGGLEDSVVDCDVRSNSGTGFKFKAYQAAALAHTWHRALFTYAGDRTAWLQLQRRAMRVDLSWSQSSRLYQGVYRAAVAAARGQ